MTTSSKDQLLIYLRERTGEWVSGESISNQMGVSRSAVWKQISKLKEEGYSIESSPKKGYLLRKASEMLLPNEIREGLETKLFGKGDIIYTKEIDSTNRKARDLADEGAPEGTLVLSEAQLRGKGRKGRTWFSPPTLLRKQVMKNTILITYSRWDFLERWIHQQFAVSLKLMVHPWD